MSQNNPNMCRCTVSCDSSCWISARRAAFKFYRPLWITRHAGHTEYSYSVTRTAYRKGPSRFRPFFRIPETGFAILHYHAGGSMRRNSFALPTRPLLCIQLGRKETRIPPHSCRFAAGSDLQEYILRSRLVCVCFPLAPDTSQATQLRREWEGLR